jgi:hypothetical protein
MKYAAQKVSGVIIYIPQIIKIGSGTQRLMGTGEFTDSTKIA